MTEEKLLSQKELATELGRSLAYVAWMIRGGFKMTGGRTTRGGALAWLTLNPAPCARKHRPKKKRSTKVSKSTPR